MQGGEAPWIGRNKMCFYTQTKAAKRVSQNNKMVKNQESGNIPKVTATFLKDHQVLLSDQENVERDWWNLL
jgi:hypothetical protein